MPPANDDLANAATLTLGALTAVNTTTATAEADEATFLGVGYLYPSVWYKFQAAATGTVVLSAAAETADQPFVEPFTDDATPTYATLVRVDAYLGDGTPSPPDYSFPVTAGDWIYLYVGTYDTDMGGAVYTFTARLAVTGTVDGRVLVAMDDPSTEPDPAWTRIDAIADNLVAGIDVDTGRQTEFDVTDTGTAVVYLNDRAGMFDPHNLSSPYAQLDSRQILIQIWNPVTDAWVPRWRGTIDNISAQVNAATNQDGELLLANLQIECVDLHDYLAGVEMLPGVFGDTPPPGSEGNVFYDNTDFQTRVEQLLTDAGVDSTRYVVFTGNVDVQEVVYDPGDSLLVAVRDALDAELPGIANGYVDRLGRFCAHGRFAVLTPDAVAAGAPPGAWDFTRWKVGDGVAFDADSTIVHLRPPFGWLRAKSRIYNAAIAWPKGIDEADIPGQIVTDATSITRHGYRAFPAMTDLLTEAGTTTGLAKNAEVALYASHYVENYKDPSTRVEQLTVKALPPGDARAARIWRFLTEHDVADVIELYVGYPGGTGFNGDEFLVQGSHIEIRPLNPTHDYVEATVNVSPLPTVNVFDLS